MSGNSVAFSARSFLSRLCHSSAGMMTQTFAKMANTWHIESQLPLHEVTQVVLLGPIVTGCLRGWRAVRIQKVQSFCISTSHIPSQRQMSCLLLHRKVSVSVIAEVPQSCTVKQSHNGGSNAFASWATSCTHSRMSAAPVACTGLSEASLCPFRGAVEPTQPTPQLRFHQPPWLGPQHVGQCLWHAREFYTAAAAVTSY